MSMCVAATMSLYQWWNRGACIYMHISHHLFWFAWSMPHIATDHKGELLDLWWSLYVNAYSFTLARCHFSLLWCCTVLLYYLMTTLHSCYYYHCYYYYTNNTGNQWLAPRPLCPTTSTTTVSCDTFISLSVVLSAPSLLPLSLPSLLLQTSRLLLLRLRLLF